MTLDTVAPVKKRPSNRKYLKQITLKQERKWRITNLEDYHLAWRNSLMLY